MKSNTLKIALIIVVVFIMYLPSLSGEFIVDDHTIIKENPALRSESPLWLFGQTFWPPVQTEIPPPYYRPITILWLWIEFHLWGIDAFMFRIFNLLLYFAIIIIAYLLSKKIFDRENIASIATAIFALHPIHIESVAFISGITDLSAGLFFLLAMLIFDNQKFLYRYILTPVLFAFALFSKETAVAGILLFPLFLHLVKNEKFWESIKKSLHLIIPLLLYFALRFWVLSTMGNYVPIWYNLAERIATMPYLLVRYVQNLLIPLSLSPYHGEIFDMHSLVWWLLWIIPMLAIIGPSLLWIRSKKIWFGILWAIIFIFPAIGIMMHNGAMWAERFAFVSSFGTSLVCGFVLTKLSQNFKIINIRAGKIFTIIYIFAFFAIGINYSFYFRSDWLWFRRAISDSPQCAIGYSGIAEQFKNIDQLDSAYYYINLAHRQDSLSVWVLIGYNNIAFRLKKYDEVLVNAEKLRERYPQFPSGYMYPAIIYFERGDTLSAFQYADSAGNVGKFNPWICLGVGKLYIRGGDTVKAIEYFNRAAQLLPDNEKIHNTIIHYLGK
ncbi:glycosyltransferase family 39 protein [bacterium]|nr:glycosyltransferase family 39 protein [bacterium]